METDIAQKILQIMFPLCAHLLELFCPFRSEVRRCEGESDLNDWPHGAKGLGCRSATDGTTDNNTAQEYGNRQFKLDRCRRTHFFSAVRPRGGGTGEPPAYREDLVEPSPATHAIFRLLKAGESVFQTLLLTKTVFHACKGAQPLFHALFGVKTLSETLFPAFNEAGLRD